MEAVEGRRYLFWHRTEELYFDGYLREVSPSGKYWKINNKWYQSWRIEVIEKLLSCEDEEE